MTDTNPDQDEFDGPVGGKAGELYAAMDAMTPDALALALRHMFARGDITADALESALNLANTIIAMGAK